MLVFAKYFTSGLTAVLVHFGVMIALVELFSIAPIIGSFAGFSSGTLVNYYLQYRWTFRSTQSHRLAFIRYASITIAMLVVNLFIFQLAWQQIGLEYKLAQVVATGVVFLANFGINASYTFK